MGRLRLYHMDMKYVRNLANVDDKVMSVSPQLGKSSRPFVGIVVPRGNRDYCIPLSSPKPKHELMRSQIDWCNAHANEIEGKAERLYRIVTEAPDKHRGLVRRCCDFKALEAVLDSYIPRAK